MKEKVDRYILTAEERAVILSIIEPANQRANGVLLTLKAQQGMSPAAAFNADFTAIEEPKAKE